METQTVQEFHVTYFDGRLVRTETFDDQASAQRFANARCASEDDWAVVDAVEVARVRIAA
ncbi:hypothetical protein [Arthrobacter ulcerisalmonis]|uniref:hypothetical protein n=1 Tax=Arthrobacter ulcerisalmonis TaxID=2483813 RepID=UPI000F528465|nr:hypothetical protein [Arthrobacter ulcerisalmonis]